MQLNRDGISKESTDTASGSDRIVWLCSNFTIFKIKSDEERAEDGVNAGTHKLVPIIARHGSGMLNNDYINCHMIGKFAQIKEGKRKLAHMIEKSKDSEGFVNEDNSKEDIEFRN
jgi:hypothetical protein